MHSAATAFAWEFGQRHRRGMTLLGIYVVALAAYRLLILEPDHSVTFKDAQTFALVVVVPITSAFIYFLAVFSFGLSGDLAARQSMYPSRMFTLPVSTSALAGWPMLYGSLAMAILWLVMRALALWPAGSEVPVIWPALLAASFLAWAQALTWMPYPLPGLRVIVAVLWMTSIDAVVMLALELRLSETVMLAILSPHIPAAFFTARAAIGRARRGDVPDWTKPFGRLGRFGDSLARPRDRFASAFRAQEWFEWRRHGRSLPALVAILLPFELAMLFLFRNTPVIVFEILLGVLFTPIVMATFVAATVSRSTLAGSDSYGLAPFIATRPLSNGALIAATLKAALRSTVAAWLLVLVAVPPALSFSGTLPLVITWMRELTEAIGQPRALAIVLLGFGALVSSTWKQLVQSLYISLSGREWIVKGSLFMTLTLLTVLLPLAHWVINSRVAIAVLWNLLPAILATLAGLKLIFAGWIASRLHRHRLLRDRTLILGAVSWDIAVFALYGVLAWTLPALLFRGYFLVLIAILAVPLTRLSAAPLALAGNRHR